MKTAVWITWVVFANSKTIHCVIILKVCIGVEKRLLAVYCNMHVTNISVCHGVHWEHKHDKINSKTKDNFLFWTCEDILAS